LHAPKTVAADPRGARAVAAVGRSAGFAVAAGSAGLRPASVGPAPAAGLARRARRTRQCCVARRSRRCRRGCTL
jgi:hypothetical protein